MNATQTSILFILSGGKEMAGRDISLSMERKVSYGTLYIHLQRLSEAGLLTQRDDQDSFGPVRFYTITEAGRKAARVYPQ